MDGDCDLDSGDENDESTKKDTNGTVIPSKKSMIVRSGHQSSLTTAMTSSLPSSI